METWFSIIVPAYNEQAVLADTLHSIQASADYLLSEASLASEIIVVDDQSTDSTHKIARDFGCTVIKAQHRGIGAARNFGAQAASGHFLTFVDADTRVPLHLLTSILDATKEGLVAGPVTPVYTPIYWWHHPYFAAWRWYASRNNMAQGVCQFSDAELFHHVGGYDESLKHAEDTDLHRRLAAHQQSLRQGASVGPVPGVTVQPSMRRYEQSSFWWTILKLNPIVTKRNLNSQRFWSEWYVQPPR